MGYTHYFSQNRAFTLVEWTQILAAFEKIWNYCKKQGIVLRFESDSGAEPRWDNSAIRFNGAGNEGHETFYLPREHSPDEEGVLMMASKAFQTEDMVTFRFCKTQRKHYDLAICVLLIAIHDIAPEALGIGSDGDWDGDWSEAREVYKILFEKDAECPFDSDDSCDSHCGVSGSSKPIEQVVSVAPIAPVAPITTYWQGNGQHQAEYDRLWKFIPDSGEVTDPKREYLEDLRMASKLYYRFFNDGDTPGEGESAPGEVYREYYEDLLESLRTHAQFLPEGRQKEAALHQTNDVCRRLMAKSFPWRWTEETLEAWINAIIIYCLDCEAKTLSADLHEKREKEKKPQKPKVKRKEKAKKKKGKKRARNDLNKDVLVCLAKPHVAGTFMDDGITRATDHLINLWSEWNTEEDREQRKTKRAAVETAIEEIE